MTTTRTTKRPSSGTRPATRSAPTTALFAGLIVVFVAAAWLSTRGSTPDAGEPAAPPVISGAPLAPYNERLPDRDLRAPVASAPSLLTSGLATVPEPGVPTVVLFLAHWCPVCQQEVPVVQAWLDAGGLPEGVQMRAVATGNDPRRPNHPPDAWLDREGWTLETALDDGSVAAAYGVTAFPFWALVEADGSVRRLSGLLGPGELDALTASLLRSR